MVAHVIIVSAPVQRLVFWIFQTWSDLWTCWYSKVPTFNTFSRNQCLHSYSSFLTCPISHIDAAGVSGRPPNFAVLVFVIETGKLKDLARSDLLLQSFLAMCCKIFA